MTSHCEVVIRATVLPGAASITTGGEMRRQKGVGREEGDGQGGVGVQGVRPSKRDYRRRARRVVRRRERCRHVRRQRRRHGRRVYRLGRLRRRVQPGQRLGRQRSRERRRRRGDLRQRVCVFRRP